VPNALGILVLGDGLLRPNCRDCPDWDPGVFDEEDWDGARQACHEHRDGHRRLVPCVTHVESRPPWGTPFDVRCRRCGPIGRDFAHEADARALARQHVADAAGAGHTQGT
jgi:hypothetical protein